MPGYFDDPMDRAHPDGMGTPTPIYDYKTDIKTTVKWDASFNVRAKEYTSEYEPVKVRRIPVYESPGVNGSWRDIVDEIKYDETFIGSPSWDQPSITAASGDPLYGQWNKLKLGPVTMWFRIVPVQLSRTVLGEYSTTITEMWTPWRRLRNGESVPPDIPCRTSGSSTYIMVMDTGLSRDDSNIYWHAYYTIETTCGHNRVFAWTGIGDYECDHVAPLGMLHVSPASRAREVGSGLFDLYDYPGPPLDTYPMVDDLPEGTSYDVSEDWAIVFQCYYDIGIIEGYAHHNGAKSLMSSMITLDHATRMNHVNRVFGYYGFWTYEEFPEGLTGREWRLQYDIDRVCNVHVEQDYIQVVRYRADGTVEYKQYRLGVPKLNIVIPGCGSIDYSSLSRTWIEELDRDDINVDMSFCGWSNCDILTLGQHIPVKRNGLGVFTTGRIEGDRDAHDGRVDCYIDVSADAIDCYATQSNYISIYPHVTVKHPPFTVVPHIKSYHPDGTLISGLKMEYDVHEEVAVGSSGSTYYGDYYLYRYIRTLEDGVPITLMGESTIDLLVSVDDYTASNWSKFPSGNPSDRIEKYVAVPTWFSGALSGIPGISGAPDLYISGQFGNLGTQYNYTWYSGDPHYNMGAAPDFIKTAFHTGITRLVYHDMIPGSENEHYAQSIDLTSGLKYRYGIHPYGNPSAGDTKCLIYMEDISGVTPNALRLAPIPPAVITVNRDLSGAATLLCSGAHYYECYASKYRYADIDLQTTSPDGDTITIWARSYKDVFDNDSSCFNGNGQPGWKVNASGATSGIYTIDLFKPILVSGNQACTYAAQYAPQWYKWLATSNLISGTTHINSVKFYNNVESIHPLKGDYPEENGEGAWGSTHVIYDDIPVGEYVHHNDLLWYKRANNSNIILGRLYPYQDNSWAYASGYAYFTSGMGAVTYTNTYPVTINYQTSGVKYDFYGAGLNTDLELMPWYTVVDPSGSHRITLPSYCGILRRCVHSTPFWSGILSHQVFFNAPSGTPGYGVRPTPSSNPLTTGRQFDIDIRCDIVGDYVVGVAGKDGETLPVRLTDTDYSRSGIASGTLFSGNTTLGQYIDGTQDVSGLTFASDWFRYGVGIKADASSTVSGLSIAKLKRLDTGVDQYHPVYDIRIPAFIMCALPPPPPSGIGVDLFHINSTNEIYFGDSTAVTTNPSPLTVVALDDNGNQVHREIIDPESTVGYVTAVIRHDKDHNSNTIRDVVWYDTSASALWQMHNANGIDAWKYNTRNQIYQGTNYTAPSMIYMPELSQYLMVLHDGTSSMCLTHGSVTSGSPYINWDSSPTAISAIQNVDPQQAALSRSSLNGQLSLAYYDRSNTIRMIVSNDYGKTWVSSPVSVAGTHISMIRSLGMGKFMAAYVQNSNIRYAVIDQSGITPISSVANYDGANRPAITTDNRGVRYIAYLNSGVLCHLRSYDGVTWE